MAVRESGTNAQISSEGSNNGFEKFCAGESDINNASTPIPGPEDPVDFRAACADNGVEYVELPIALDAIVLIAATGWGQASDRQLAFEAGFDHHLTKPIDFERLRTLLAEPRRVGGST